MMKCLRVGWQEVCATIAEDVPEQIESRIASQREFLRQEPMSQLLHAFSLAGVDSRVNMSPEDVRAFARFALRPLDRAMLRSRWLAQCVRLALFRHLRRADFEYLRQVFLATLK